MGRSRSFLTNLAVAVGALVVVVLLAEVGIRIAYGERFAPRPGFYVADAKTGWRPARNLAHTFYAPDFETEIVTDDDGVRLGALGPIPPDAEVILLVGDSFTFGWGVSTGDTYASTLDVRLHEESGGTTRAVNLGVGGYGLIQSHDRLVAYLEAHPGLDVLGVIVHHAPNDPADNLSKLGYHLERWEPRNRVPPRSSIHGVNLVTQLWHRARLARAPADTAGIPSNPHLHDMLFAFERFAPDYSLPAVVSVGEVNLTLVGLERSELEATSTLRNEGMTERQRYVMEGALSLYARLARRRGLVVLHTMVPTAPKWYADELQAMLPDDPSQVWVGTVVEVDDLPRPILNPHSGGHYTPDVNRRWAEAMAACVTGELLRSTGD